MPRRRCCGKIDEYPVSCKFESACSGSAQAVKMGFEEVEAIRLKDMLGYDQQACASEMGLTRPTFQRILAAGRKKLAAALVEGRTIVIEGGHYRMEKRVFECLDCGQTWEVEPCTEGGRHGYEIPCPKCGSMTKSRVVDGEKHACSGHQHDHGHHGGCCHGK